MENAAKSFFQSGWMPESVQLACLQTFPGDANYLVYNNYLAPSVACELLKKKLSSEETALLIRKASSSSVLEKLLETRERRIHVLESLLGSTTMSEEHAKLFISGRSVHEKIADQVLESNKFAIDEKLLVIPKATPNAISEFILTHMFLFNHEQISLIFKHLRKKQWYRTSEILAFPLLMASNSYLIDLAFEEEDRTMILASSLLSLTEVQQNKAVDYLESSSEVLLFRRTLLRRLLDNISISQEVRNRIAAVLESERNGSDSSNLDETILKNGLSVHLPVSFSGSLKTLKSENLAFAPKLLKGSSPEVSLLAFFELADNPHVDDSDLLQILYTITATYGRYNEESLGVLIKEKAKERFSHQQLLDFRYRFTSKTNSQVSCEYPETTLFYRSDGSDVSDNSGYKTQPVPRNLTLSSEIFISKKTRFWTMNSHFFGPDKTADASHWFFEAFGENTAKWTTALGLADTFSGTVEELILQVEALFS